VLAARSGAARRALRAHRGGPRTFRVALVACDALPGALDFAPLRALMRFHVVRVQDPTSAIAQARAIARWHLERTRRAFSDANPGFGLSPPDHWPCQAHSR